MNKQITGQVIGRLLLGQLYMITLNNSDVIVVSSLPFIMFNDRSAGSGAGQTVLGIGNKMDVDLPCGIELRDDCSNQSSGLSKILCQKYCGESGHACLCSFASRKYLFFNGLGHFLPGGTNL